MRFAAAILLFAVLAVTPAQATIVNVTVTGQVDFNTATNPPLDSVVPGADVVISFNVSSDEFVDGPLGHSRSYVIDPQSFTLSFDSLAPISLLDPLPDGTTAYFTLVDSFPVADGFFVSTTMLYPWGVPLSAEPYSLDLDLDYDGETIHSLDILEAEGVYDFDGLTRYTFDVWSLTPGAVVMGVDFGQMTISTPAVPAPAAFWLLGSALLGVIGLRRRR